VKIASRRRRLLSECAFECDRRFMQDFARSHESILGDDILALWKLLACVQSNIGSADKLQFAGNQFESLNYDRELRESRCCREADE
jgi:hypothetical protein